MRHRQAGRAGHCRRTTDLPGAAPRRLMQDGLPVHADQVGGDLEGTHRCDMAIGEAGGDIGKETVGGGEVWGEVQNAPQIRA